MNGPGRLAWRRRALWLVALLALPAVSAAQRGVRLQDPADDAALAASDVLEFQVAESNGRLHVEAVMAAPIEEGMFTCVDVHVDCDGNPDSGLHGSELWIRAAVGSRFWPNDAPVGKRGARPITELRQTGSTIEESGRQWVHSERDLPDPVVEGRAIRFSFPIALIQRQVRYESQYRIRAHVETSCSEQPIVLDHAIRDEGLPIELDGELTDWRGGTRAGDDGAELHSSTRALDVTRARVEHGAGALFVGVGFDEPGFDVKPGTGDVIVRDALSVFVDAPFPRYQAPRSVVVARGAAGTEDGVRSIAKGDVVELEIDRKDAQRRVLVHIHTDALRQDWILGGKWFDVEGRTQ